MGIRTLRGGVPRRATHFAVNGELYKPLSHMNSIIIMLVVPFNLYSLHELDTLRAFKRVLVIYSDPSTSNRSIFCLFPPSAVQLNRQTSSRTKFDSDFVCDRFANSQKPDGIALHKVYQRIKKKAFIERFRYDIHLTIAAGMVT